MILVNRMNRTCLSVLSLTFNNLGSVVVIAFGLQLGLKGRPRVKSIKIVVKNAEIDLD